MITAKKMYKKTLENSKIFNKEMFNKEIAKAEDAIVKASEKGEFFTTICICYDVRAEVIKELESYEYLVTERRGWVTIQWDKLCIAMNKK